MPFAFVFPGQGSQSVGMLSAFANLDPVVRATFDKASNTLGYDLWKLTQEGPAEKLNQTEFTQPALLTASIATLRLWQARGGDVPTAVTGHSLGEYSALVASGVLDFGTAVAAVQFRGQVMQQAVPEGTGLMAVVLGPADAVVEEACREAAQGGVVEPVNYNCAGQVVIAGETEAVNRAIEVAKTKGARRAMPLAISVPAHSSLMQPAAKRLGEYLQPIEFRAPKVRFFSAVDGAEYTDPAEIRKLMVRQLASPVRWQHAVRALAGIGITQIIECGPGKVLAGLGKRIEGVTGVTFSALEDPTSLDAALAATKGS